MWTDETRGHYDRSSLRYPSDLTDPEWSLVEGLIARQAQRPLTHSRSTGGGERVDICAQHGLPVAGGAEGAAR